MIGILSDEPELINDAIANALSDTTEFPGIARTIDADRVVYSFAVRGEHIELLGIVSLIARLSGTQIEPRPLQTMRQLVQPALECLRRELALRAKLGSSERDLDIKERDLELMMEISSNQSAAASDADEFSLILKTGLDRMGCALAALWVPDKNISVSMTRSGAAHVAGSAAARPASFDGVDADAAAHHRHQSYFQSRDRCRGAVQDPGLPDTASLRSASWACSRCSIRRAHRISTCSRRESPKCWRSDRPIIIQAQYDTSTGLMTRQAFERQATGVLGADGASDSHIIFYLDIDRLHVINETFGMHVGDDVIVSVADRMAKTLPAEALSARISGDRLAALIPNSSMEVGRGDRRADSRRRREHRAARGTGLIRSIGMSSGSRRSAAPTIRSRTPWPPRKSPVRRRKTAAAIASRFSRIPTRASSDGTPTSW